MSETPPSFVAPEGSYTFLEEHKASTLSVSGINAAAYPTRISTITIRFHAKATGSGPGFTALLGGVNLKDARSKDKEKEKEREKEAINKEREGRDSYSSSDNGNEERDPNQEMPAVAGSNQDTAVNSTQGESNGAQFTPPTLFTPAMPGGRRKSQSARKMQSIRTTNSSFVTRLQSAEGLNKLMANQSGDTTFLFFNASKSFVWTQVGQKLKEPLAKITFSAFPTCHDVNKVTACPDRIDVIVGFSTGDLIWFDPISSRYVRLNKQPTNATGTFSTTSNACTAVRWVPSSTNLFLVSFADGTMVVYDRDREDGPFTPREPHVISAPLVENGTAETEGTPSATEWDPIYEMFVSPNLHGLGGNEKALKNPVSHWRVSKKKITDFAFSPDVRHLAVVSEDGCLRVIDALSERLVDTYSSYFGYLTAVAWSPDGRFIITGGQDDLVTIVSPSEQRIIARCQGHSSFVAGVAFDPTQCDGRTYRFASVGEDNRLLLWDFSSGALHRPKLGSAFQNRASISSTISLVLRRRTEPSNLNLPVEGAQNITYHPAPSRNDVSVLQPIQTTSTEGDLLTRIEFTPTTLATSTRTGVIRIWGRPGVSRSMQHGRDVTITSPRQTPGMPLMQSPQMI